MVESKAELRRHFSRLRDSLTLGDRTAAEEKILARLFSLPAWENAPLICGYMPTKSEMNTLPLWKKAADEGKAYALPVTVTGADQGKMIFRRLDGFTPEVLVAARYGLWEPPPHCPALTPQDFEKALIIVPGLAFDDKGFRIGYGGGYYDRLLAELSAVGVSYATVGLVYASCHVPTLPRETHDIPVDYIIDERKVITSHG